MKLEDRVIALESELAAVKADKPAFNYQAVLNRLDALESRIAGLIDNINAARAEHSVLAERVLPQYEPDTTPKVEGSDA